MDRLLAERKRSKEKVPVLLWTPVHRIFSIPPSTFKAILEALLLILHCKTTYCCHTSSSSTSVTLGTLTALHSIIQSGLIPGGESLREDGHAVFFTAVNPMRVSTKKSSTTGISPGLQCAKILGKFAEMKCIDAI